ncbi:hypothetical protein EAG_07209 [Camponotus floridanus]|uniref:Single domain-containing protein n=1 Tax=Camponotus floridanus TaxID=104421 RepID=E2A9H7_CAMFO|nr:uncharacterized protein LOC105249879 [Camponotus floridanus]EFN69911.1 hypothetical protein EAG_07209 [Camponotus floridanus]
MMKKRFTILLLVCVFAYTVLGNCLFENETLSVGEHIRRCLRITCYPQGSISLLACPLYQCPEGKQIGYRDVDPSKPFPECCEGPICKEEGS